MKRENHYDIVILGGGASGLCAAIMAKNERNRILVIEHNERVGKKLLSTGNGKCNLTNLYCKVQKNGRDSRPQFVENPEGIPPYYSSLANGFAETVISAFDADRAVSFFKDLGMLPLNRNGCIYPRSEQASSVLDLLRLKCGELGVDFLCGYQPVKISKKEAFFIDGEYSGDCLVLAAGGRSASKTGSDGSGYEIAKSFGHTIIAPVPGLCALKCSDPFFKELAGVRTDARLSLFDLGSQTPAPSDDQRKPHGVRPEPLMTVSGNLQFNSFGISGIPVFQLSLPASRLLYQGHQLLVRINLLPEIEEEQLMAILSEKSERRLLGILHKKLAHVIEKESDRIHPHATGKFRAAILARTIQKFKVHPVSAASFEEAQTTLGGVSTAEISPRTMESRNIKGLYFTGEIVDVSGICGGYNLQWAWATAYAVSRGIR